MTPGEYRRDIKDLFTLDDYKNDLGSVAHLLVHFAIIVVSLTSAALNVDAWPWYATLACGVIAGHSGMVASFAGHEIGHGGGRMPLFIRRFLELLGWTFVLFATPTTQRKAHNVLHHGNANSPIDPDRRLMLSETEPLGESVGILEWLIPNVRHPILTRIWGFSFMIFSYHNSLLVHSLFRTGEIYDIRLGEKPRVNAMMEFTWNVGVYFALWALSGFSGIMLATLVLTYFTLSTMAALYITTNHLLSGLIEGGNDPLATTVSVKVPAWIDFLHLNFSHHTEHHLYPTASYRALPVIKAALCERFPETYRELEWKEAIRYLMASPIVMKDANTYSHLDGSGDQTVYFPTTARA